MILAQSYRVSKIGSCNMHKTFAVGSRQVKKSRGQIVGNRRRVDLIADNLYASAGTQLAHRAI